VALPPPLIDKISTKIIENIAAMVFRLVGVYIWILLNMKNELDLG
jgi:hypothetical protein